MNYLSFCAVYFIIICLSVLLTEQRHRINSLIDNDGNYSEWFKSCQEIDRPIFKISIFAFSTRLPTRFPYLNLFVFNNHRYQRVLQTAVNLTHPFDAKVQ